MLRDDLAPTDPAGTLPPAAIDPPAFRLPGAQPLRPQRRRRLLRWGAATALLLFLCILVWLAVAAPPSRSLQPIAAPSLTLRAADGAAIAIRGADVGRPVDVTRLPPHVAQAFVAIEDRRFYRHWGVDPLGIARAAWRNARAGGLREGGSTITQQLAKLVYLNSDRSVGRKAREALIAMWLEAWLTKDQILSRYLSTVYFGDNVYGLRSAARHYFSKAPEDLSVSQAALLAGLMKAPSRLAPTSNLSGAQARAALVVGAMVEAGFITSEQASALRPARLRLQRGADTPSGTYFADWVYPAARAAVKGGYEEREVRTTLDSRLQRSAERAVRSGGLRGAQVALVAMKPDGTVVAMVGGRRYGESSFNRAVQARRQPGSTFKLFVYLAALRSGLTPDDLVEDTPLTIGGWSPVNADHRYRGKITLREAFARSSNVAAVRLAQRVGPEAVVRAARDLGITSPLGTGASLALGTSSVSLIELDAAFAAVAGNAWPVRAHGLPEPPQGWIASMWNGPHHFSAREHAMLLDLLSASVNEGTGRSAALRTQAFGKTGTSQGNRDAIFVGFAGGLVTAVWVGNDDDRPLPGVAGGGLPARIWRSFMADALGERAPRRIRDVDPDAGPVIELGNATIGDVSIGLHLDGDGVHVSTDPVVIQDPPPPPPEPADEGLDEQ